MSKDPVDLEKGVPSATARSTMPSWASSAADDAYIIKSNSLTPLQLFQQLVGIHTPTSLTQDDINLDRDAKTKSKRSRTDNVGLYQRAREQERTSKLAYQCTSIISNTLYMCQILLAATFTALSAYKATHPVTLTVLGAVSTVFAG
jgi:hypothetical protein